MSVNWRNIQERAVTFVHNYRDAKDEDRDAKPSMRIDDDLIEDREWLQELIRITADSLPAPKAKKRRSKG